jgi:hypothetical protein
MKPDIKQLAAEWAADDRKWNTQEVVERNLIAFVRKATKQVDDYWRERIRDGSAGLVEAVMRGKEQELAEREKP